MNIFIISGRGLSFFETVFNINPAIKINLIASSTEIRKMPSEILAKVNDIFEVEEVYNPATRVFEFNTDAILRILCSYDNVKVVCIREENMDVSASLRDSLKINSGMNTNQLRYFRDKALMKNTLAKSSIRTPKFLIYDDQLTADYNYFKDILGPFFIAKPISSLGSKGVYKIKNNDDFKSFAAQYQEQYRGCPYELEEFISFPLFHVDAVMQNSKLLFISASEYSCPVADFFDGKVFGTIPLLHSTPLSGKLIETATTVIEQLGNLDSVYHIELFYDCEKNECIFLEIAARPAGYIWPKVFRESFGINLYDAQFLLQSGIEIKNIFHQTQNEIASCFLIPATSRPIKKISAPDLKSIFSVNWYVNEGPLLKNNEFDFSGIVFMKNNNYEVLYSDFRYMGHEYQPFEF
jgi:hypothetical protein